MPFLWPGSTVGPGGKHAPGGALPAPARQRLASALVAENEGQRMALASKTALISHHLLRDPREGLGEMPGMWMRRPRGKDRASQCDLIVVGAILLFNVNI